MNIENIIANIQSAAIFLVVLSVLIIVHEWGHFITAKRLGVDVQRFALGFGPTLFSKVYHGTRYMINLIPLGGYVKMAGDDRAECKGEPGEFLSKPVGHRALVVLNGPVVNFVLAYVCFVLVFMLGYPGQSTKILGFVEGGPAQVAGLQIGDKITAIESRRIYGWMNLEKRLEGSQAGPIKIKVLRGQEEITKTVFPNIVDKSNMLGRDRKVRDIGIINPPSSRIGGLGDKYPAKEAGVRAGDEITEIDSIKIYNWNALHTAISNSKGRQIKVTLVRNGNEIVKMITPKISIEKNDAGQDVEVRRIGVSPLNEFEIFKFGPGTSLVYAYEELAYITGMTYEALYRMIIGKVSAKKSVTGPVGIFYIVIGAAAEGISHLLFILGVISASLAIFNLLPIIPLDGGHLFLLGIEKIRGQALPQKVDEYVMRIGFSLIILLALFVFYADFARFGWIDNIKKLFP